MERLYGMLNVSEDNYIDAYVFNGALRISGILCAMYEKF